MQDALSYCRQTLREQDVPRYLLSLTLPPAQREALWAMGAWNVEVSRATQEASEPAVAAIRLKWWLDALQKNHQEHPVLRVLALHSFDKAALQAAIEAREAELEKGYWFADVKALDAYALATGGFWAVLDDTQAAPLAALGQVWALTGLLWATGYQLSRGHCTLPKEVTATHGIDPLNPKAGDIAALEHIIVALAKRAETTLNRIDFPNDFLLKRAVPFLRWRLQRMQQNSALTLQTQPYESRLAMLWKIFIQL